MVRAVFAGLLCGWCAIAGVSLHVDPAASSISLRGETTVSLAVHNDSGEPTSARISLEWMDPRDAVRASREHQALITPGQSTLVLAIPLPRDAGTDALWYRLRYRIHAEGAETGGSLTLANASPDAFELRVASSSAVAPGEPYRVTVVAVTPISKRPVAGVRITETLSAGQTVRSASAVTGADGAAAVAVAVPADAQAQTGISLEGRLGDFIQSVSVTAQIDRSLDTRIDTDKPIYQPGQTLHIRLLCRDYAHQPAARTPVTLSVLDLQNAPAFTTRLETDRFGVAAADWKIPPSQRLGEYRIDAGAGGSHTVKISRYELPSFTVTTAPDRPHYLPGQSATVEVRAQYLFGKPVPNAHVRVVRAGRRDSDEGQTDASGRYPARLNLAAAHKDLESSINRYQDVDYTAYVTDPTSGRTEERRFNLRVTAEAIHLYVFPSLSAAWRYIAASYADGSPASCRVLVNSGIEVLTNRYGLARLPVSEGTAILSADDGKGAHGRLLQPVLGIPTPSIQTDKTLYRSDEAIRAIVRVPDRQATAHLDVTVDGRPVASRQLDTSAGFAAVALPWQKEFAGEVGLWLTGNSGAWSASRSVLFPAGDALKLDIQSAKATYRPGEEASVSFAVHSAGGDPVEAALGVAVVDAAVTERAGATAIFSKASRIRWSAEALPGVPRDDLERIDFSRPIPEDLDLLAEALLAAPQQAARINGSPRFADGVQPRFLGLVNQRLSYVAATLKANRDLDYPRDPESLRRKLAQTGIDFDTVRDPWDNPYQARFGLEGRYYTIQFISPGPDRQFGTADDVAAAELKREWFAPYRRSIGEALRALPAYPETEADLRRVLEGAGIGVDRLFDPWGSVCAFRLRRDRVRGLTRMALEFRSPGPDRILSTADDLRFLAASWDAFTPVRNRIASLLDSAKDYPRSKSAWDALLASAGMAPPKDPWGQELRPVFDHRELASGRIDIIRLHSQRHDRDLALFFRSPETRLGYDESLGAIEGVVTDPSGAFVPGAEVNLTSDTAADQQDTRTDERGHYIFDRLIPGIYTVRIEVAGFRRFVAREVLAYPAGPTIVDAVLQIGGTTETITVEASSAGVWPSSASTGQSRVRTPKVKAAAPEQGTPRAREYFPETLLWSPQLETGPDGRTRLSFPLADSITTWKLEAIASNATGAIVTSSVNLRAFQPFFVDHNPPPILTQGDEIHLPVAVRNYAGKEQAVQLAMKPADWLEFRGPRQRRLRVTAGDSATAMFSLRAASPVTDGTLRVDADGGAASDAIEKRVTVHPDHRLIRATVNGLLSDSASLELSLPEDVSGQPTAELKIYSNLLSHVVEGVAGVLRRPYGCGEQTTSSTYPSLMLLRLLKRSGIANYPRAREARKYLEEGLGRLAGFRGPDGGFTYWGQGPGHESLTAYVLGFLTEAKEVAFVDEQVIRSASEWLAGRQSADGSWGGGSSMRATAAMALTLARAGARQPAAKALHYLTRTDPSRADVYTVAATALLAIQLGDRAAAEPWLKRLRRVAQTGRARGRWDFEGETPFHGWGLPGQVEASALAVHALLLARDPADTELISDGLAFLLGTKDQYGVWFSGHTTVQVLEAILAASGREGPAQGHPQLLVNGRPAGSIQLPAPGEMAGPVIVPIPAFLHPGTNRIAIQNSGGAVMRAQIVASYYGPWANTKAVDLSSPVRLWVTFDKTQLRLGETVSCRVEVDRRFGSGMLLAEIGLPPGVDVDRVSLEEAKSKSNGWLNSFEVLPDRLIVYLWPSARHVSFSVRFQPRFAMSAKTAASEVYDYYNPEARFVVAPVKFWVE